MKMMHYVLILGAMGCCAIPYVRLTQAADQDQIAIRIHRPDEIVWQTLPHGMQVAAVVGNPSKPGLYAQFIKSPPHNISTPHAHPNDRVVTVISGTWWVGTGKSYEPEKMVPQRAGTVVTLYANQLHYEGTKDEPTIIEIVGMGPAASNGITGSAEKSPQATITPLELNATLPP